MNGLSFSVRPGRVTGFLGRTAPAKSTTKRLILRPKGRVLVNGKRYRSPREPSCVVGALLDARWVPRTARRGRICDG